MDILVFSMLFFYVFVEALILPYLIKANLTIQILCDRFTKQMCTFIQPVEFYMPIHCILKEIFWVKCIKHTVNYHRK